MSTRRVPRSRRPGADWPGSTTPTRPPVTPQAARAATRQMAEINAAYEELRDPVKRRAAADRARGHTGRTSHRVVGRRVTPAAPNGAGPTARRPARAGPPRPRPTRPVTARLDMSDTFAPRNQTVHHGRRATYGTYVAPPPRNGPEPREAPRASDPTGPAPTSARPPLPAAADPRPRRGAVARRRLRQVPRPHARRDRGLRAVLHRLARRARSRAIASSSSRRGSSRTTSMRAASRGFGERPEPERLPQP